MSKSEDLWGVIGCLVMVVVWLCWIVAAWYLTYVVFGLKGFWGGVVFIGLSGGVLTVLGDALTLLLGLLMLPIAAASWVVSRFTKKPVEPSEPQPIARTEAAPLPDADELDDEDDLDDDDDDELSDEVANEMASLATDEERELFNNYQDGTYRSEEEKRRIFQLCRRLEAEALERIANRRQREAELARARVEKFEIERKIADNLDRLRDGKPLDFGDGDPPQPPNQEPSR